MKIPPPDLLWDAIAPCDHVVQVYAEETLFLAALEGYVAGALARGEAAIVLATPAHLEGLESRLGQRGFDLEAAVRETRYVARSAPEVLDTFMVDDWPDAARFEAVIQELLRTARGAQERKVRVFGEMVAILWARGLIAATLHLEELWNDITQAHRFPLFCAYPGRIFTRNAAESLARIGGMHTRVFA